MLEQVATVGLLAQQLALPDTLNRFEAPLWLFIFGMESSILCRPWRTLRID